MHYIMRKSYYVMHKLLRYAKNVLRYATIIILCVVITLCGVQPPTDTVCITIDCFACVKL